MPAATFRKRTPASSRGTMKVVPVRMMAADHK